MGTLLCRRQVIKVIWAQFGLHCSEMQVYLGQPILHLQLEYDPGKDRRVWDVQSRRPMADANGVGQDRAATQCENDVQPSFLADSVIYQGIPMWQKVLF